MPLDRKKAKNLTWVKGDRENLDNTSRKNLAGGRKQPATSNSSQASLNQIMGSLSPGRNGRNGKGDCVDGTVAATGTSIFDPVLCEIAYRWFSPPGGLVLDPFAGGSVRGIVAAKLGRQYIGVDLSARQIAANEAQAAEIVPDTPPRYVCGNSADIDSLCAGVEADMLFTCPPYADLEVYSEDPADLSTMPYPAFRTAYFEIIRKACALLKRDRFACIVVGEVRGKDGAYYDFVGDTVRAFMDAGLKYYNEAILITMCGSLPIRAGKQFKSGRKLGKTHQNVLVFLKGDAKKAVAACGNIEIDPSLFEAVAGGEGGAPLIAEGG